MKGAVLVLIFLVVLSGSAMAVNQVIGAKLKVNTGGSHVGINLDGGNTFELDCNITQTIEQNLTFTRNIQCDSGTDTCEGRFDDFTSYFHKFTKAYNQTFYGCNEARTNFKEIRLKYELANESLNKCTADLITCDDALDKNETKYKQEFITMSDRYNECASKEQKNCQGEVIAALDTERKEQKDNRNLWGILGLIIGAGGMYGYCKPKTGAHPAAGVRQR